MASFEEKLIALSSAETLKKGKAHLKQKALAGAWRNKDGGLCGVFASDGMLPVETVVSTGENAVSTCSCNEKEFSLCSHAVALLMYSGRFALKLQEDEAPPVYSKGLVKQSFAELSARGMSNSAKLYINVVEDHAEYAASQSDSSALDYAGRDCSVGKGTPGSRRLQRSRKAKRAALLKT